SRPFSCRALESGSKKFSVQSKLHELEARRLAQGGADMRGHRVLHGAPHLRRIPDDMLDRDRSAARSTARLRLAAQHQLDGAKAARGDDDVFFAFDACMQR